MKLFTQHEQHLSPETWSSWDNDDETEPIWTSSSSDCCARCILLSNDSYNDGSFNICLNWSQCNYRNYRHVHELKLKNKTVWR
jgi:hypothetical protein